MELGGGFCVCIFHYENCGLICNDTWYFGPAVKVMSWQAVNELIELVHRQHADEPWRERTEFINEISGPHYSEYEDNSHL